MLSVNSVTSRFFKGDIFCLNIWSFWKSFGPTSTLMFVIATYCWPLLSLFFKLFLKALVDHSMLCYICSKLVLSDFLQVLPQIKRKWGACFCKQFLLLQHICSMIRVTHQNLGHFPLGTLLPWVQSQLDSQHLLRPFLDLSAPSSHGDFLKLISGLSDCSIIPSALQIKSSNFDTIVSHKCSIKIYLGINEWINQSIKCISPWSFFFSLILTSTFNPRLSCPAIEPCPPLASQNYLWSYLFSAPTPLQPESWDSWWAEARPGIFRQPGNKSKLTLPGAGV